MEFLFGCQRLLSMMCIRPMEQSSRYEVPCLLIATTYNIFQHMSREAPLHCDTQEVIAIHWMSQTLTDEMLLNTNDAQYVSTSKIHSKFACKKSTTNRCISEASAHGHQRKRNCQEQMNNRIRAIQLSHPILSYQTRRKAIHLQHSVHKMVVTEFFNKL